MNLKSLPSFLVLTVLLSGCGIGLCAGVSAEGRCMAAYDGPRIALSGQPIGTSRLGFLDVTASGADFTAYRYKVGTANNTDCADDSGYSVELPLSTKIIDLLTSLPDTGLMLCAVGKQTDGRWQNFAWASVAEWIKDMTPVVEPRFAAAPLWLDYISPSNGNAACNSPVDSDCVHAGEIRQAKTGLKDCTDVTASDSIGAFLWRCTVENGEAVVYSKLRQAFGLRDLVTHGSPSGAWKPISLTVVGRHGTRTSALSTTWWTNPVLPLPNSSGGPQTLGTTSAIYTLNASANTQGITMANKQAVVGIGSPILTATAATGYIESFLTSFTWLEGVTANAAGLATYGARLGYYAQIRRFVGSQAALDGLNASSFSTLVECAALSNVSEGIILSGIGQTVADSISCNNGASGIRGGSLKVVGTRSCNNGSRGIRVTTLSGLSSTLVMNSFFGNGLHGVYLLNSAGITSSIKMSASSLFNNGGNGQQLSNGGTVAYSGLGILAVNNGTEGIDVGASSSSALVNVASAHNGGTGVIAGAASTVTARGFFLLGNNATNNCNVAGTANFSTGANNATCTPTGGLTEAAFNANLSATIVGKASSDSVNINGGGTGTAAYAVGIDWTGFQNTLRGWGMDGAAFPAAGNRSRCAAGTCRIWDASLSSADTLLLNKSGNGTSANSTFTPGGPCPTEVGGNVTATNSDGEVFLRNAYEIVYGDYQGLSGDYDGLCEAGETCVYMPNVGAYQGHGALESCSFTAAGGISGVNMYGYQFNTGR